MKKGTFLLVFMLVLVVVEAQINITDSIIYQGITRDFILHLPPGYNGTEELPLVMVLHGGGGTALNTIGFTEMDLVADTAGFIAVFPQGGAMRNSGYSWADGRGTPADEMGIDDVGFISALIDTLQESYAIDEQSIYATGFSNGGFMCQRLACELSDRLAAVASGGSTMDVNLRASCMPGKPVPMLIMHGDADPFVPYNGGTILASPGLIIATDSLIRFWVDHNNCSIALAPFSFPDLDPTENSTVSRFEITDCECDADVVLYKIENGGHTWPGVENKIYEIIAGQTNEDIHASVEIWNFFRQHQLDCSTVVSTEPLYTETDVKVFPNPGTNQITISGIQAPSDVFLIAPSGQTLLTLSNYRNRIIDVSKLPVGLYFIQIQQGNLKSVLKWVKN